MKYGLLSLLAGFIILLLVFENYETWMLPSKVLSEKGPAKKSEAKVESPQPALGIQKEPPSIASYVFVSEKNVFTPDRKEFPVFAPEPAKEIKKPIVRPQVILYGVTLGDNYQSASISNLNRGPREREITTVKIGNRVGEYKLAKILPDRIALEAPEDRFEVLLYDSRAPKKRIVAKTENKPAAVTSTLASPPAEAAKVRPAAPGAPIRAGISETPVPRPVSPAPVPSARTRRWTGDRFRREGEAPAPQ